MKTLLVANLSTKTAGDGSNDWTPPAFVFGESFTIALRMTQDVSGQTVEQDLDVRSLAAAIGAVDARPTSGTFALQIGSGTSTNANTTAALPHDCTGAALGAAINALAAVVAAYGTAKATKKDGSWFVVFGAGGQEVPMQLRSNELVPLCLGRVNASAVDGVWTHELRLVQLPVVFTDTYVRVLPPQPTIKRIVGGGSSGDFKWNEVQALSVPPDFRDTFALSFGGAKTAQLSVQDTTDTIQAALVLVLGSNFTVSAGAPFTANIEFTGKYEGAAEDLIVVDPLDPPPAGDLTFTLDFTGAELLAALRTVPAITLPLEVRMTIDDALTPILVFRQDLTILAPVQWPELATTPRIDWLRAPSPKSYLPFSAGGVVTGSQHYTIAIGDGVATTFALSHGLATEEFSSILVRENHDNGRVLPATEYGITVVSADEVDLIFTAAPAAAALIVTVTAAITTPALAAHHHSIADIDLDTPSLADRLAALESRVTAIEALLPSTAPSLAAATGTGGFAISLADKKEIFPGRFAAGFDVAKALADGTGLPRAGALLPAIHTSTVGDVGASIGAATARGGVFANRIDVGAFTVVFGTSAHLVNCTAHGRAAGDVVRFTGTLPAPLAVDTDYYVIATGLVTNAFEIALTSGGAAITFTTDGTGNVKRAGAPQIVASGMGHRSFTLAPWALVGSDQRVWYPVSRRGTTTSYYPTDAERTLFTLPISPEMLAASHELTVLFSITLALLQNTSNAQILVVVEVGTAPQDTTPATTGANLQNIVWNTTPLMEQRIVLTDLPIEHKFGAQVLRAADGSFTAQAMRYNAWTGAAQIPTDPTFTIRARLVEFDTEDSIPTARGLLSYDFHSGTAAIV